MMYSNLSFNFANQNYLVTGASSGMGRLVAEELAKAGATVLAMARREDRLQELVKEYPGRIVAAAVDVADYEAVENAVKDFVSVNGKFNGIVYAAGVSMNHAIRGYSSADGHALFETNFWGIVDLFSKVISVKYMRNGSSNVIFSSTAAYKGSRGVGIYSASKSAIRGLVRALSREIAGKGHRVNTVSPGWVSGTEMTATAPATEILSMDGYSDNYPLGLGKPEDVVGAVLFLLSDAARWITGTDILIDGGRLA